MITYIRDYNYLAVGEDYCVCIGPLTLLRYKSAHAREKWDNFLIYSVGQYARSYIQNNIIHNFSFYFLSNMI